MNAVVPPKDIIIEDIPITDPKAMYNTLITEVYKSACNSNMPKISTIFFSQSNLDKLHKAVITTVYNKSLGRYKIVKQSNQDMIIAMKYIYEEYSMHLNCKYEEQLIQLNNKMLEYVVPRIINNLEQHDFYVASLNVMHNGIEPPQQTREFKSLNGFNFEL